MQRGVNREARANLISRDILFRYMISNGYWVQILVQLYCLCMYYQCTQPKLCERAWFPMVVYEKGLNHYLST